MLTYGDVCSGISCPMFAFKNLGIDVDYLFACDNNKSCKRFLQDKWSPKEYHDDIRKIEYLPHVDVMLAGFCCQPFSSANISIKFEDHPTRDLWLETIRCVKLSMPKMVILENVRGFTFKKHKPILDDLVSNLKELGYNVDYKVLDSRDYGTPQLRTRVFFIGKLDGSTINWPDKTPLVETVKDIIDLDEPMKVFQSKGKYGQPKVEMFQGDGSFIIGNGQGTGAFTRFYHFPITWVYCILTKTANILFQLRDGVIYGRPFTKRELCRFFGLDDDVFSEDIYSLNLVHNFLGNGIELRTLQAVLKANITQVDDLPMVLSD